MNLTALGFIVGGLAFSAIILRQLQFARASRTWPTVPGVIIHSDIEDDTDDDTTTYKPVIFYSYQVNGETLTGDRIGYLVWFSSSRVPAQRYFTRYPLGKAVTVYVDPQRPTRTVLEPGYRPVAVTGLLAFGLGLIALGVGLAIFA